MPAALVRWLLLAGLAACASSPASTVPRDLRPSIHAQRPMRPDSLEHAGAERDSDLLSVTLDLRLHVGERRIEGCARNRLRALIDGTQRIRLHAVGLSIASITDSRGRALAFAQSAPDLDPYLDIDLSEALRAGEEETLSITYSAHPERGLYFVEGRSTTGESSPQVWSQGQPELTRHWIPTWDYPNDRARFEGRFSIDEGLSVVSNGVLVSVDDLSSGERTFHWKLDQEIPTYLIALAAGRWERYEDSWRGLPLEYDVPPGTGEEKARRAFGETPAMLEFFTGLLQQPFPYPKYAQVAVSDFVMAGMENASVTLESDDLLVDESDAIDLDGEPRLIVAHELAHQWFGDLVTCLGWTNLWLNEGWASYLELLFEEHQDGRETMRLWLERFREEYLARGERTRLPLSESWRSQASDSRCNHEYEKGPWVLYMIQRELGDAIFWQGVRAYLAQHANGLVTSHDFARSIFDATGRNIEPMLEPWVEGSGHPVYAVDFDPEEARRGTGELRLHVRQVQVLDDLVPLFDMPVSVELFFEDGSSQRYVARVSEIEQTVRLPLHGPLIDLVFDADCGVLCQLSVEKDDAMWAHQAGLSGNSAARWRAIDALEKRAEESPIARAALLERLRADDQALVRVKAARSCRFRQARPALLRALQKDADARVRLSAARHFVEAEPDADETRALEAALASERSPAVSRMLMRALGRIDAAGPKK